MNDGLEPKVTPPVAGKKLLSPDEGDPETKHLDPLPKTGLPGVVCEQWVRCGKPHCRCARGDLHGPYHYRFWREQGRLRRVYVRRAEVDGVRAACELRRQIESDRRVAHRRAWALWRQLADCVREGENHGRA